MPKRRSLWPLTWLPRPSTKRPFELACRSQAWLAITVGLRGKATAIDGVSSMRSVASAAKASGVKTSCPSSTVISASKPAASAAAPNRSASRQCLIGSIVKTRIPVHSTLRRGNRIIAAEDSRAKQDVWMTSRDYQIFELGDVALQSGLTLRNAQLAYKTYGRLDAPRSNVIVYPTSYGAQHYDTEWLIRPGRALDRSGISSSSRTCSGMACRPRRAMSARRTIAAASRA